MKNRLFHCRILSVIAAICFLGTLSSCKNNQQQLEPQDPYQFLLFPTDISFGMSTDQVQKLKGEGEAFPLSGQYFNPQDAVEYNAYSNREIFNADASALDNYCYVEFIRYVFDNPREQEFENETTLVSITISIKDSIVQKDRTKERHGDIDATYDNVRNFLKSHYGEPVFIDDQYQSSAPVFTKDEVALKKTVWELEDGKGVVLQLLNHTNYYQEGNIILKYIDTTKADTEWDAIDLWTYYGD